MKAVLLKGADLTMTSQGRRHEGSRPRWSSFVVVIAIIDLVGLKFHQRRLIRSHLTAEKFKMARCRFYPHP